MSAGAHPGKGRARAHSDGKAFAELLGVDEQLCFTLYATANAMTRSYAALLAPLGLTYPQYLALLTLFESDGRSVGEIGGRLGLDSGTLTPLLKRLERGGYVERRRGEADEREVRVRLTRTGRALEGKLLSVQHDFFCSTALTLEQLTALRCELLALGENLRDGERRGPRRTTSIHRKKRRGVGTPG